MNINGKLCEDWTKDDLHTLINNDDFRECQFLDYKRTFEFLEAKDKSDKTKGKSEFRNDVCSFANADGVWFPSNDGTKESQMLRLFNNGSVELKIDLPINKTAEGDVLIYYEFPTAIEDVINGVAEIYKSLGKNSIMYACVSIIGAKGCLNEPSSTNRYPIISKIDRNRILCEPIEIKEILDSSNVVAMTEECKKVTRYSLGIKDDISIM